jgi:hypothetical protein
LEPAPCHSNEPIAGVIEADSRAYGERVFSFMPPVFGTERAQFPGDADLSIIPDARFQGNVVVDSHSAIPFEVFATTLP